MADKDLVNEWLERLQNDEYYWSESQKAFTPIKFMPIPHAENAMRKLERLFADGLDELKATPLYQALQRRVDADGVVTEIAPDGNTLMLRGEQGRFTGAIKIRRVTKEDR